jgi:hypothetical protein
MFKFCIFLHRRLGGSKLSCSEHSPSVSCNVQYDNVAVASSLRVEGSISEDKTDKRKAGATQIAPAWLTHTPLIAASLA